MEAAKKAKLYRGFCADERGWEEIAKIARIAKIAEIEKQNQNLPQIARRNADQKHTQICSFLCSDHRITRSPDHPISISVIGGKVFPAIGVEYSRLTMTAIPQPEIAAGHSNVQAAQF